MLLVMLAFLGGSLGFAEYLVKRQKPIAVITARFLLPPGVKDLPVNDSMNEAFHGPLKKAVAQWSAGSRTFVACSFDGNWDRPMSWSACLDLLRLQVAPASDGSTPSTMARIAAQPALELRIITAGPNGRFDLIRLTIVENGHSPAHVVAFAFSGSGNFTEIDNRFFQDYCTHAIKIGTEFIQP